ncbi:MAG TPA: hypothetical protein VGK09_08340 [Rhodocyclaceae bacterium]|jgi:hypothetical protein
MLPNARIAEQLGILATIDPVSQAAGTITTGWISASRFERFMALIQTGVMGASATLDGKLQQAQDSSGTGAKDITNKALAQIVKATGDNKQAEINLRAEELDLANGFTYFRLSLTVGTAASLIAASVLGGVAKNAPASALNQAGVVQNVS